MLVELGSGLTLMSKGLRQLTGVYIMQEISDHFGSRYFTVSLAVRWL